MRFLVAFSAAMLTLGAACRITHGDGAAWQASPEAARVTSSVSCRPVDGAWAIALHVQDAATGAPVADAVGWTNDAVIDPASTDSSGWLCVRTLRPGGATVEVSRPGYRTASISLSGSAGQVVARALPFRRVARPCCDLRGRWRISFDLEKPAQLAPRPTARSVTGELALGPRVLPPQEGDALDSLVRVVRGLHHVDFGPFFGGPVAPEVSRSVFGSGPDLLHEVEASVPAGDSVAITFIPRMSHGSLSLWGRIHADTVRGEWVQNAYCCGARGRFVMTRLGPPDTTPFPRVSGAAGRRSWRTPRIPPAVTPAGHTPGGRWQPQLAVDPDGRLWLANDGLFVADSLLAPWRRVLGGASDPVAASELRISLEMAFPGGGDTALIGMRARYPVTDAPILYRSTDAGASWRSLALPRVRDVEAMRAVDHSVWLVARDTSDAVVLLRSRDAGATWTELRVPETRGALLFTGLHRVSDSVAYLYGHTPPGEPTLWRTTDGGHQWLPLPAPHDQGLQHLEDDERRIEEMATVGSWILVREHGRVFVSPAAPIHWRPLPEVDHVASEPGGGYVFVLGDSLRPALLDENVRPVWRGDRPLALRQPEDVEQVLVRDGVGYVSERWGGVFEVRNGVVREVPSADGPPSRGVRSYIAPR